MSQQIDIHYKEKSQRVDLMRLRKKEKKAPDWKNYVTQKMN